jgi:hypothetical protein
LVQPINEAGGVSRPIKLRSVEVSQALDTFWPRVVALRQYFPALSDDPSTGTFETTEAMALFAAFVGAAAALLARPAASQTVVTGLCNPSYDCQWTHISDTGKTFDFDFRKLCSSFGGWLASVTCAGDYF